MQMLEALESASSTELQNGVKALQRVMDRRLLAEHPIARLMICMDGDARHILPGRSSARRVHADPKQENHRTLSESGGLSKKQKIKAGWL